MGLFDRFTRARAGSTVEARGSIEDPTVPVSAKTFLEFFGLGARGGAGVPVTVEAALGVPSVWAAVNFISSTVAALPLHVYRRRGDGSERVGGGLTALLRDAVNPEVTSFDWRKMMMDAVLTGGRHQTFIERTASGRPVNLWPLDPANVTIRRVDGRTVYDYRDGGRTVRYDSPEIIDLTFMKKADGINHRSPVKSMAETIGLAIASTRYGARFFAGGGVPPFAIEGAFQTKQAMQRAADDMNASVKQAAAEDRLALILPNGIKIHRLGDEAAKNQLVETKRFLIEEVARIYSLPPVFVQDLTHGTFSNTEQQDLHLVKHTLTAWTQRIEQELNLKLFGRNASSTWVQFNIDGLLRGDFKTRMEGLSSAVQNGLLTPNEGRAFEDRPPLDGGDNLMIQGATVPLAMQGAAQPPLPVDQPTGTTTAIV